MSERTYKIGEVAQLLNLKSYVLRFWETEFPMLSPIRTEKGQRLYRESDIELLQFIRNLLHERGLTIEGARKVLQNRADGGTAGLTSELLDEGYKDFGGEGIIPPAIKVSSEPCRPEQSPATQLAALAASQKLVLDYAVQELKELESLLKNQKNSE